jgi:hypothetical protein
MNAAQENLYPDDSDPDYQTGNRRETAREPRARRPQHIRTSRPAGFNGKHRRRNKRYLF